MSDKGFDPERVLGDGIRHLGREELISFARSVCMALIESERDFHGRLHPWNVVLEENGSVTLGPPSTGESGSWTTDELEFMAPELFWNGEGDPTADVYSIGLMLYAGVTGGRLPFFSKSPDKMDNKLRAAALRSRMNGRDIPIPAFSGEKLGAVMKKALAFEPAERYSGAIELLEALTGCVGEGDAAAVALFGRPERELTETERIMAGILAKAEQDEPEAEIDSPEPELKQEQIKAPKAPSHRRAPEINVAKAEPPKPTGPRPSYKVDKNFEETQPPKPKKSWRGAIIVFGICAAVIIAALAIHIFSGGSVLPTATPTLPVTATPAPTATPKPTPTPVPTPTPTPIPTAKPESTYAIYAENISWTDAKAKCEALGGHLVTISDAEELKLVTDMADKANLSFVWIGFMRGDDGNISWVTGEDIDYFAWGRGEPSRVDSWDGAAENYGLLWKNGGVWSYNDSRNAPAAAFPQAYNGKIGYVCEFEG